MSSLGLVRTLMTWLRVGICLLGGTMLSVHTQAACTARVLPEVQVAHAGLFLSDLFAAGSCSQLTAAAAMVRLGAAPLAGSDRVLEGREVRALLARVLGGGQSAAAIRIPERVRVRRAVSPASCAEIASSIFSKPNSGAPEDGVLNSAHTLNLADIECGARIPRETPVEAVEGRWDAGLGSWELRVRCRHSEDCVPFLIRVPGPRLPTMVLGSRALVKPNLGKAAEPQSRISVSNSPTVIRRGQTASLVWDKDGIRTIVPSVSLDSGNQGETVRARIAPRGRVVRAIVTGAGQLRMVL
jgi:Chaperone for flagella basal body P-ring formation